MDSDKLFPVAYSLSTRTQSTFTALHSIKNKIHGRKYFSQCLAIISHLSCSNYHPQSSNYIITDSQQVLKLHKIGSGYISCKQPYLFIYPVDAVGFHGLVIDGWRLSQSVIHSLSKQNAWLHIQRVPPEMLCLQILVCFHAVSLFSFLSTLWSEPAVSVKDKSIKICCLLLFPPATRL